MKKHLTLLALCLTTLFASAQSPANGSGTKEDPYRISNAEEMLWFANLVNGKLSSTAQNRYACAELTADIDLASVCSSSVASWTPIGFDDDNAYGGTFDGKGHTVSNIYINTPSTKRNGLFGTTKGATIKDIKMQGGIIDGYRRCAALVGSAIEGSHIEGAIVNDISISGENSVGAVAGGAESSDIINCSVQNVNINAQTYVGGLCGYMDAASVSKCTLTNVSVSSTSYYIGGVIGDMKNKSSVNLCCMSGSVKGTYYIGGFVGYSESSTISCCMTEATVTSTLTGSSKAQTGGFAGYVKLGEISQSFTTSPSVTCSSSSSQPNIGKFAGYCSADVRYCSYLDEMVVKNNGSAITNSIYTMEGLGNAAKTTAAEYANGQAAFFLNKNVTGGNDWMQNIGTDDYPSLNAAYKVYASGTLNCDGSAHSTTTFTNNSSAIATASDHSDEYTTLGICSLCNSMNTSLISSDANGVFQIANAKDLQWFAKIVNSGTDKAAKAVLTNDIDLSSVCGASTGNWDPIGNNNSPAIVFCGSFDGQGHDIKGLYINATTPYQGLFGYTDKAEIKNFTISASSVTGTTNAALAIGYASGTSVSGITTASDAQVTAGIRTAGIIGYAYSGCDIKDCHNAAAVTCTNNEGAGVAGYVYGNGITIENCSNSGIITATKGEKCGGVLGGLASTAQQGIIVTRCFNTADITAQGGVIGASDLLVMGVNGTTINQNLHIIKDCANTGNVTCSHSSMGGVIGYATHLNLDNCYNTGSVTSTNSQKNTGGVIGNAVSSVNITNSYCDATTTLPLIGKGGTVDSASKVMPAESFANGEICYLLNTGEEAVWYQTLNDDSTPTLDSTHKRIYYIKDVYCNALIGDVNLNGEVNISDVTALINIVLGKSNDTYGTADLNADGNINISDVTKLVNIILDKNN